MKHAHHQRGLQEHAMSEYELLDLFISKEAQMASQFSISLSILPAYIAVAYLVGRKLTWLQITMISGLFLFGAGGQTYAMYNHGAHVMEIPARKEQLGSLTPYESEFSSNLAPWVWAMAIGVVVSFYFMCHEKLYGGS